MGALLTLFSAQSNNNIESPYPLLSHDFETSSLQEFIMTGANFGSFNGSAFAISLWFKRESIATGGITWITSNFGGWQIKITSTDAIDWAINNNVKLRSTAALAGDTNWHHLYVIHNLSESSGNKQQMWFDGVRITAFSIETESTDAIAGAGSNTVTIGGSSPKFDGLIYQFATFSGTLPTIDQLYNGGAPKDIREVAGLWSLLDPDTSIVSDYVLAADWTNNNGVTTSADIPSA